MNPPAFDAVTVVPRSRFSPRFQNNCRCCGVDISGRPRQTRFCGKPCCLKFNVDRERERHKKLRESKRYWVKKTCVSCGAHFVSQRKQTKNCSPQCTIQYNESRIAKNRSRKLSYQCGACGKRFIPKAKGRTAYCGRECYFFIKTHGTYARQSVGDFKPCRDCGELIPPTSTGRSSVARCAKCQGSVRRAATHRNRAMRRAATTANHVDPKYIFDRDSFRCGICGKMADQRKKVPHRLAPVIDHIIPIARGGTHESTNLQCAHFSCNNKKSAGDGGQLRLIG